MLLLKPVLSLDVVIGLVVVELERAKLFVLVLDYLRRLGEELLGGSLISSIAWLLPTSLFFNPSSLSQFSLPLFKFLALKLLVSLSGISVCCDFLPPSLFFNLKFLALECYFIPFDLKPHLLLSVIFCSTDFISSLSISRLYVTLQLAKDCQSRFVCSGGFDGIK